MSDSQRHQLYRTLDSTLGEEATRTVIELFPTVDWTNVATKDDIVNARIDGLEKSLRAEMAAHRFQTEAAFSQMATKSDLMDLRSELNSDQRTSVLAMISAMALLMSVAVVLANLG